MRDEPPRKIWIGLLLCSVVALALYTGSSHKQKRPLRLAIHPCAGCQTLTIGAQQLNLDPDLVKIIRTTSVSTSTEMLLKDGADGATLPLTEILALRDKDIPLTIILVLHFSAEGSLLLTSPHITQLTELKDATIGLEDSTSSHIMLGEILTKANLTRKDVSLRFAPVEEHKRLWNNLRVDALITSKPLLQAMHGDGRLLFNSRKTPRAIPDVLAIRSDRINQFSSSLLHLTEQHFAVAVKLRANSPDTLHRVASILGTNLKQASELLSAQILPGVAHNHTLLSTMPHQELHSNELTLNARRILEITHPRTAIASELLNNLVSSEFLPVNME